MSIGTKTGIGWTDSTWNVLAGCEECDPGCANCYAKNVAQGMVRKAQGIIDKGSKGGEKILEKYLPVVQNSEWTKQITITEREIIAPIRQRKSNMIFVNSMSDLFYKEVPDEWIDRHLMVMYLAKWQYFQVLTKRHKRLKSYFENLTKNRILDAFDYLHQTFGLNGITVFEQIKSAEPNEFVSALDKKS